jgi:hypothetical protein
MKTYIVTVIKTESYSVDIKVKAESAASAEKMAEDMAQDQKQDWSYDESEFTSYAEEIYS